MPLFDQMHYDEKWSVWDTWWSLSRNARAYLITAGRRMSNIITTQKRWGIAVTTQKRRGNIITGV